MWNRSFPRGVTPLQPIFSSAGLVQYSTYWHSVPTAVLSVGRLIWFRKVEIVVVVPVMVPHPVPQGEIGARLVATLGVKSKHMYAVTSSSSPRP
jgi:hypothetical protein